MRIIAKFYLAEVLALAPSASHRVKLLIWFHIAATFGEVIADFTELRLLHAWWLTSTAAVDPSKLINFQECIADLGVVLLTRRACQYLEGCCGQNLQPH
ncbi:hypothetical protein HAX54_012585 [Datura stramonium]|uniref:Secreted protein n=1 Tax=Datura stramonium TaxID=4076 RepID=A0ABS8Y1A5_DATST|nr:hypothetical protein [Datura stramonium]